MLETYGSNISPSRGSLDNQNSLTIFNLNEHNNHIPFSTNSNGISEDNYRLYSSKNNINKIQNYDMSWSISPEYEVSQCSVNLTNSKNEEIFGLRKMEPNEKVKILLEKSNIDPQALIQILKSFDLKISIDCFSTKITQILSFLIQVSKLIFNVEELIMVLEVFSINSF
jgi:hypothetical protein